MEIIGLVPFAGVVVFGILFAIMVLKGGSLKIPVIGMGACFALTVAIGALIFLGIGPFGDETADESAEPSGAVESESGEEDALNPEAGGQKEEESDEPALESAPQTDQGTEQVIPDPVTYTGNGDDVVTLDPFDGVFVFHITGNNSGRHFAVKGYDSNGESTGLFVNTTSAYDGITIDPKQETTTLEVNASGDWIIEIQSISEMKTISSGGNLSGSGDSVIVVSSYGSTAAISGNANSNHFSVKSYGKNRDKLLVNTTDVYEGTVMLSGDPIILEVNAVGEWNIAFN